MVNWMIDRVYCRLGKRRGHSIGSGCGVWWTTMFCNVLGPGQSNFSPLPPAQTSLVVACSHPHASNPPNPRSTLWTMTSVLPIELQPTHHLQLLHCRKSASCCFPSIYLFVVVFFVSLSSVQKMKRIMPVSPDIPSSPLPTCSCNRHWQQ